MTDRAAQTVSESVELVWTPEMIRRFWAHEKTRPENYFSYQVGGVVIRRFRRRLLGRVVDYGAGLGFLMDELLVSGVQCGAVEFGDDGVKELSERFATRKGFLGARSHEHLAEWRDTFDAVLLLEVIEHLYDNDLQNCLSNVRSLLKPGGWLIVTTPNEEDRSRNFISSPESGRLFHRFQHVRSWDERSLASFLDASGFDVAEIGATDFSAHPLAHKRTMSFPVRVIRSVALRLMNRTPHLYAVAARRAKSQ